MHNLFVQGQPAREGLGWLAGRLWRGIRDLLVLLKVPVTVGESALPALCLFSCPSLLGRPQAVLRVSTQPGLWSWLLCYLLTSVCAQWLPGLCQAVLLHAQPLVGVGVYAVETAVYPGLHSEWLQADLVEEGLEGAGARLLLLGQSEPVATLLSSTRTSYCSSRMLFLK